MNKGKSPIADELEPVQLFRLAKNIKRWGKELGFAQLGICDTQLEDHEKRLASWLEKKFHGSMAYMERHGTRRSRPGELIPGTVRVISVRMNYLSEKATAAVDLMKRPEKALISRYALGRDYHKVMRKRLQKLCLGWDY